MWPKNPSKCASECTAHHLSTRKDLQNHHVPSHVLQCPLAVDCWIVRSRRKMHVQEHPSRSAVHSSAQHTFPEFFYHTLHCISRHQTAMSVKHSQAQRSAALSCHCPTAAPHNHGDKIFTKPHHSAMLQRRVSRLCQTPKPQHCTIPPLPVENSQAPPLHHTTMVIKYSPSPTTVACCKGVFPAFARLPSH